MSDPLSPSLKEVVCLSKRYNVIPIFREIVADLCTPVSLLSLFYQERGEEDRFGIFLFESAEGSNRLGRYSFLGLSWRYKIEIYFDFVRITSREEKEIREIPHHGDPLGILRQFQKEFHYYSEPDYPEIPCGPVGYFSYETVSFFEKIPVPERSKDQAFAVFTVPDEMIVFDNQRHRGYLVKILYLKDQSDPESAYRKAEESFSDLLRTIGTVSLRRIKPEEKRIRLYPVIAESEFEDRAERVKKEIEKGEIIQLVLSQPFISGEIPDPILLYRAQRLINPSPYMYFLHLDDLILVGSSPETMVRLKHGHALVRPIAGTRPRGRNAEEDRRNANDLLQDEKERAEHLMLVDLGRNDLGRSSRPGSVQVTELMCIERYSHVMHLVSSVESELSEDQDAYDLFRSVFPAGTLSGAPKVRAMELIADLEKEPRGAYGGAVGYIGFQGDMDFAITIRTACISNHRLTVQAGAGIVYDSDPEHERQETVNKAKAIQTALEFIPALN
ncbi:MAG: chorismate-binding protein [Planctomycetia bacterium]|nr:chorismate-binding protein [Planctomycetia bacterium]